MRRRRSLVFDRDSCSDSGGLRFDLCLSPASAPVLWKAASLRLRRSLLVVVRLSASAMAVVVLLLPPALRIAAAAAFAATSWPTSSQGLLSPVLLF